jgi:serine/threonine protein phosphatase PrpC
LIEVAQLVLGAKGKGQDRIAAVHSRDGIVVALADGAGGMSEGAATAEEAVRMASTGQAPWTTVIQRIDENDAGGQCALVVVAVEGTKLVGASVGDCGAWLITEKVVKLTERQIRKPLVGSGQAVAVAFEADFAGTLLLASDGLFNYVQPELIVACARKADLQAAAEALANLPRLRSGKLPDDVSVVLCRRA